MKKLFKYTKKIVVLVAVIMLFIFPTRVLADSDDDEGNGGIALLLLSGPIYYGVMSAKYSGKNKRHAHEQETESVISNLQEKDTFAQSIKKSTTASIGEPIFSNQQRIKKNSTIGKITGIVGKNDK